MITRLAVQREAGCLAPLGGERRVAESTATTSSDDESDTGADEISEDLAIRRDDDGAIGDGKLDVGPVGTVAV